MEFKVGDRVRIKSGAVDMDLMHIPGMRCLEGGVGTIESIESLTDSCLVKADGVELRWWWKACALEPATAARALIEKMFPEAKKKEEPPKYFTGRVVCVERPEGVWFTVGKIYEIKDGVMGCDEKYVNIEKITSVENLNARVKKGVKFIEIKE